MVRVREVEVQIGWGTIFGGEVRLESVRLMAPEITLERLADGRANWNFVPAEASAASGPGGAAPALDALTIEDGRIRYRDAKSRRDHRIEGLSASLSAADLVAGPFRFEAEGRLDEAPLVLRLKTGRITPVGPTPVELEARLGALDVRAAAKIVLAPTLSVEAKVKLGVIDLGALPAGLVPSGGGQGAAGEAEPFVPPGNVAMTLDLDVEAIRAHGQTSGPARARLEMAGGRLRIPEMTVEAPGGGRALPRGEPGGGRRPASGGMAVGGGAGRAPGVPRLARTRSRWVAAGRVRQTRPRRERHGERSGSPGRQTGPDGRRYPARGRAEFRFCRPAPVGDAIDDRRCRSRPLSAVPRHGGGNGGRRGADGRSSRLAERYRRRYRPFPRRGAPPWPGRARRPPEGQPGGGRAPGGDARGPRSRRRPTEFPGRHRRSGERRAALRHRLPRGGGGGGARHPSTGPCPGTRRRAPRSHRAQRHGQGATDGG